MIKQYHLSLSKHILKAINHFFWELGFKPASILNSLRGTPIYLQQVVNFYIQSKKSHAALPISIPFPCLTDRYQNTGHLDKHYFHQDLWAARIVYKNQPEKHVDVGSRIDGFVAHLLSFRDVEVLDVRKIDSAVGGMTFRQADLMDFDNVPSELYDSVSCLHALEHFGLGRYGDPVDPEGHIKGFKSLIKLLKSQGILLLSVPIGKERVEFNAHRIFAVNTIMDLVSSDLELISFSYIDDSGKFYQNAKLTQVPELVYGCGLFEFRKK